MRGPAGLVDLLVQILPRLGPRLAGEADRFIEAAAALPLTSAAILEFELGTRVSGSALSVRARNHPDFEMLESVLMGRMAGLHDAFPEVWLEYDLGRAADAVGTPGTPSLFLRLNDQLSRPPLLGPKAREGQAATRECIDHAIRSFQGKAPDTRLIDLALGARPASSRLSYLGLMLSRGDGRDCRLTLDSMPLDGGCTALLDVIGWTRGDPALRRLLADHLGFLASCSESTVLHLDLSDGAPGQRLGFEAGRHVLTNPDFRTEVVARGLITPGQLEDLDAWPQQLHRLTAGSRWPEALQQDNHLVLDISHLKFGLEPEHDPPWNLKAYLGVHWGTRFPDLELWGGGEE